MDGGGGRIHTLTSGVGEESLPIVREMYKLIAPLGIAWDEGPERGGCGGGDRGPYRQAERREIYDRHLEQLIAA